MSVSFLTITKSGTGSGTVTSDVGSVPGPIDCGATCSDSQTNGTTVTLTATPSSGSVFIRWTGGLNSTSNPISYVQSSSIDIDAEFRKRKKKRATGGQITHGFVEYIYVAFPKEVTPAPIVNHQNNQYSNPALISSVNILAKITPLVPEGYSNLNSLNSFVYIYYNTNLSSGQRSAIGYALVIT